MTEPTLETRNEWPLIERVRVLDLGPNDTVVLEVADLPSPEQLHGIISDWRSALPDSRPPIVLSGSLTLAAVLREAEEAQ